MWDNGNQVLSGIFKYFNCGGPGEDYLLWKGTFDTSKGGGYERMKRVGEFTAEWVESFDKYFNLLIKGNIYYRNGDISEGERFNFKWYDDFHKYEGTFTFAGEVFFGSTGEKKSGVWNCLDLGKDDRLDTYLGPLESVDKFRKKE